MEERKNKVIRVRDLVIHADNVKVITHGHGHDHDHGHGRDHDHGHKHREDSNRGPNEQDRRGQRDPWNWFWQGGNRE